MLQVKLQTALLSATVALLGVSNALAGFVVVTPNPKGMPASEIGVRVQLGNSGVSAAFYDGQNVSQDRALDFLGRPNANSSAPRQFEIVFDTASGQLGFKLDLDRSGSFESNEQVFQSSFANTAFASYAGRTFEYLSIAGNSSNEASRSRISNLSVGGSSFGNLDSRGGTDGLLLGNQNLLASAIRISGSLSFGSSVRGEERPTWDFVFRSSVVPLIPEPSAVALFGSGALLLISRRRR
jgi:hypothetical protein